MKTVRSAAAACALLALAGCGTSPAAAPAAGADEVARAAAAASATPGERHVGVATSPARFGEPRAVGDGLVVTVSGPTSFTPSDLAYPRSPRAVAFEITIDNQGASAYRPTQLVVKATARGAIAEQVADTSQGYGGIVGAANDVPPEKSLRLTLAFAVPTESVVMRVSIQPDASATQSIVEFSGTV